MPDSSASISNVQQLVERLKRFEDLNPELAYDERQSLFELASQVGPQGFSAAVSEIEKIIKLYLSSPVKHFGKLALQEYFTELAKSEKKLLDSGIIAAKQLPPPSPDADATEENKEPPPSHSISSGLVRYSDHNYTCLERCIILNRTNISQTLTRAADAFRRRLSVVDTVMEICFQVLWRLDSQSCQNWMLDYLDAHKGELDTDVIRDFLIVVLPQKCLDRRLLAWAEHWSNDDSLFEYWPQVVSYSDRLLCRQALQGWRRNLKIRSQNLAHLVLLLDSNSYGDDQLLRWEELALESIGACVQRFFSLSTIPLKTTLLGQEEEEEEKNGAWRRTALYSELNRIAALLPPILIIADQILRQPDGANKLAMAFMGLVGDGLEQWDKHNLKLCERAVLRNFLVDLKEGRTPVATIKRLTFGDSQAFNQLLAELDLVTQQFDSLKQRDKVIKVLAVYYASFRYGDLLGNEVSRRYRNMRRILHEDYWRGHLDQEQFAALQGSGVFLELNSLLAASRKFLDNRSSLSLSLEEMLANEMEFSQFVRQKRLAEIHTHLN